MNVNRQRTVQRTLTPVPLREGAGVVIRRSIGASTLRHLDPFLLLDYFDSEDPRDYIAGFPDHPHRGFVTVTYMLAGRMLHQDSLGNRGELAAGSVQWMKAASGVIHSEMPQQEQGRLRGFQLWLNLPAREKMSPPAYQEFGAAQIPTVVEDGVAAKVLCGQYAGASGPIADTHTRALYLDVRLRPGAEITVPIATPANGFVYVYEGQALIERDPVPAHTLAVLAEGDVFRAVAGSAGGAFILVAAEPIGEPIVQYGPFVMNSREEIEQALDDYRRGTLVRAAGPASGP